jgi:hypothetical protein
MSSLADLPDLVGFFSYSRRDDANSEGALTKLRARIQSELRLQLGRDFRLWQDTSAIADGAQWEDEIKKGIAESVFFIPMVTPSAVGSEHCRFEFESFLKREAALGRSNLIFPLIYVRVPALESEALWRQDDVLRVIGTRQYLDWQRFRHRSFSEFEVAEKIERFCANIVEALRQRSVPAEARQALATGEEQRSADLNWRQQNAQAEAQRKAVAEAEQLAEEERFRYEAEIRRAEEERKRTAILDTVDRGVLEKRKPPIVDDAVPPVAKIKTDNVQRDVLTTPVRVIAMLLIVRAAVSLGFLINTLLHLGAALNRVEVVIFTLLIPLTLNAASIAVGILALRRFVSVRGYAMALCAIGLFFQLYNVATTPVYTPMSLVFLPAYGAIYLSGLIIFWLWKRNKFQT